ASEGKLSVHAKKTEGVLGNVADALNRMFQNVGVLIGESKNASAQVEQAAAGIASYAEALTHGAAQQSEQVHHTIQDVETMTAEAQNISKNSKEAAQSATLTRQAAEKGANGVTETVQFMERLEESVQATAQKINDLGKRSEEISGIVQSISDISAETDVLAMNASIEAARAGEQGKGFTIVADQVRALADRTRLATVEIEKLVRGIQSETSEAVRQMDSQTQEVRNGVSQVISAGKELSNIVETSVDSSTLAGQISLSSTGQENRAQAVLNAVISINQVAEETRNRTVEFQQTSEQLAMLANELNKQLANFEVEESTSPQHTQSEV
ncbi:MAG: methyl-accepting chemotaxis protein, partial [Verrucomicrobiota bacterium]